MKYILTPKNFTVRELFNPKLGESGKYYYYVLEKEGISHKEAKKRIGVKAWFCGVKDKNASTKQWFCTEEPVDDSNTPEFRVKFRGNSSERIFVGKHKGNVFNVIVDFEEGEEKIIKHFKASNELVCNYFGEQRFSKNNVEVARIIAKSDYELALKTFLTKSSKFDTPKSTKIKEIVASNWGNWEKIMQDKEIKETKKIELFEYLKNNPSNFKDAFLHAEPKSVKILIKTAQAMRFNEKLNELAKEKKPNNIYAQIVGQNDKEVEFALSSSKAFTRELSVEPTEFEKKFRKGTLIRRTFFAAGKFNARRLKDNKFELSFELGRGQYATVFLKFLNAWLAKNKL